MAAASKLSNRQGIEALAIVAAWMGKQGLTEDGAPAPTGRDAAYQAEGPELIVAWDWPSTPTDSIVMEGGLDEWAYRAADDCAEALRALGIYAEPYASYALCLYPIGEPRP